MIMDKQLINSKKTHLQKLRLFSNLLCFINDLFARKYHLEFDINYEDTNPAERELETKRIPSSEALFLNLSFIIGNKKFKTKVFDK